MQALTVFALLRVSQTNADSVLGIGILSGICTETIGRSERTLAHQGMDLKCAPGLATA